MARAIALMTLFNPQKNILKNIEGISSQVERIFLCDNSNCDNEEIFSAIGNATYVSTRKNLGISTAFNNVLRDKTFEWKNDDFIIFFDQDSKIKDGHVQKLEKEFSYLLEKGINVGCLGPVYFNRSNGSVELARCKKKVAENAYSVDSIITSSMLTTYGRLEKIDFFNDEVFLDFADWDLCWRFTYNGMKCCVTDAVILDHAVGDGDKGFGPVSVKSYSPQREYYQVRDSLYLMQKRYTPPKVKVWFATRVSIKAFFHCLVLDDKQKRLKDVLRGYRDYRHDITGE